MDDVDSVVAGLHAALTPVTFTNRDTDTVTELLIGRGKLGGGRRLARLPSCRQRHAPHAALRDATLVPRPRLRPPGRAAGRHRGRVAGGDAAGFTATRGGGDHRGALCRDPSPRAGLTRCGDSRGRSSRLRDDLSWREYAHRLEVYLDLVQRLFWPELIIIGGGVSKKSEKFLPHMNVATEVVPARMQNEAGIVGAAMAAAPQ